MNYFALTRKLAFITLMGLFSTVIACDDTITGRESAVIEVIPDTFRFPATQPGEDPIDQMVVIRNIGDGDLLLADFVGVFADNASYQLDYRPFDPETSEADTGDFFVGIDPIQGNLFPGTISIKPDEALALKLRYTPDALGAGGEIQIETNAEPRDLVIPIQGVASAGDIAANPTTLDFGRVNAGETQTLDLTLTNVGTAPVMFTEVFLNTNEDFSIKLRDENVVGSSAMIMALQDPDNDGTPGLSPTKSVIFQVTYAPPTEGPDSGEVVFALAGAIQDNLTVNIVANGAAPCLNLLFPDSSSSDTSTLQFGPALIGATTPSEIIVESCGGEALNVSSIRYEGAAEFALAEDAMPFELPAANDTRPSRSFTVNFSPTEADVYEGTLIIVSNDPAKQPELRIPVIGRGTLNACPIAAVNNDRLDVLPLEIITLDASPSTDSDGPSGRPVSYEWVVISRPDGSTAQPVERFFNPLRPADGGEIDNPSTPTAQFFVDLAGEYVFGLVVTDDLGFSAPSNTCPQQEVEVVVNSLPDEDIHIELTWTTPGDANETDTEGTDVDLHFRHPNSQEWNRSPYDCYFANPNPDWGPSGPVGNPSLDIDDVNGAGPENINLNDPEFTDQTTIPGPYLVGVHYYSSGGLFTADYGASEATIRIYLGGSLAGTYTRVLQSTENFWEVAGVIWTNTETRVQEYDRFYAVAPW
ncbi:MAG: hypothetical protein CMH49_03975 [Myxococcales bacterium]|nr:hypothetical protein [Myxococcales bacterium]